MTRWRGPSAEPQHGRRIDQAHGPRRVFAPAWNDPAGRRDPPDAPSIDGLTFRLFRDESDYAHVVELINGCSAADGVEDHVTVEWAT